MPTPPKPFEVLKGENKSHRTNEELELRKQGEASLITGVPMQCGNLDAEGKKEFERIKNLLAIIGKDDALYEGSINRYCELKSEVEKFKADKKRQEKNLKEATKQYSDGVIEFLDYMNLMQKIAGNVLSLDRQIQAKRKMMLDIEKEDVMTIASALRSIPKKVEPKKENKNGIAGFTPRRDRDAN